MNIFLSRTYSFCQLGQRKNQEDARFPDMDIIDKRQCFLSFAMESVVARKERWLVLRFVSLFKTLFQRWIWLL